MNDETTARLLREIFHPDDEAEETDLAAGNHVPSEGHNPPAVNRDEHESREFVRELFSTDNN